jgi:fluoroquinolone resistance protein
MVRVLNQQRRWREYDKYEGAIFHNGSFSGSRFVGETDALPVWGNTIMKYVKINGEPFA